MRKPNFLKFTNPDSLILLLAVLVLVTIAALNVVTNHGIGFLQTSNRKSNDAYILKSKVQKLLSDVLFMESTQRGSVISEELNEAKTIQTMDNVKTDLMELQPLVYESITKVYDQLAFFVNRKIKFNDLVLNAYKRGGKREAESMMDTNLGDQIRDSINKYASRLEVEFSKNVQVNLDENYERSKKLTPVISILSILSFIVIVALSIRVVYRINQKNKLIRKLRVAHRKQIKVKRELEAAKREAESLATLKQNFLANMSHEIRTPINAVIGFSNILQKTRLTKEQKKFVKLIQTSGSSLLSLVNDILDFSKIEAGMVKIESIDFDLRDLTQSIVNMFQANAKEKGVELSLTVQETCPNDLEGDPLRLTQILTNLISNALKFTNEGSVNISVTIKEKTVDDCLLKFVVRDSGVGMTGQQLEKIFERFDQGENDISRKYGGTGLGLAIVKNLVELQGGNIYAESKSNVGSTFIFEIPFKLQTEKNKVKVICPQSLELDKELKLLVVDDNEMNLMLVEYLLSDWGIYYQTASNGAEAIAKLQQSEFNLVLMDVQMPEMDGYTATQKIRTELNMNIPIIAMTAHVLPGEQERCKAQGMDDYISKPLQEETLQRIIAKYSGKKPKASDETNTGFIDAKMLHHKFSGNIDFIKRIVSKTLHHFTGELQELNTAIFNKDATAVMELAHKMRSTVSLLSHHSQLVDWLSEIEILSTKKVIDWEQITALVKNLTASEEQLQSEAQILLNDIETKALLQP